MNDKTEANFVSVQGVEPLVSSPLTLQEREELMALSKEVFGASSRYKKLMENGYTEMLTDEIDEIVPGEKEGDPDTHRTVKVPKKREDGAILYTTKYHTKESIKAFMVARKQQIDDIKEQIKRKQEEEKAKKLASEKVQQEASGSAV